MRVVVNTADGKSYTSKEITEDDINPDEVVETGDTDSLGFGKHRNMTTLEDFKDFINDVLVYDSEFTSQVFTINTEISTVKINVRHVVSWEFV